MSLDFDVSIDSEQEEDPVEDGDTIKDISSVFRQHFTQNIQESASLKRKYISFAAADSNFSKIAIGMANEMQIYDVSPTGLIKNIAKGEKNIFDHPVSGLTFFNDGDPNTVLASTIAGEIHMYDLRTYSRVHTFEDDTELVVKPVNCFDVNSNNRLICAGSDEISHNVYLLFFDVRERRTMGGFFESHQEEVTDVKFHPTDPDTVASGSTDGLINIFDCKKETEDDALKVTLNTGDSVAKLAWHEDKISCITNTNDLLLYDVNEQDLLKKWDRASITEAIKRKSVIDCNLIDCYNYASSEMMFLATSNYNKGECLRSINFKQDSLEPIANFTGNSQIIRASLFNEKDNIYFTFGENSIISIWKEGEAVSSKRNADSKEDSSIKKKMKKKSNPY